MDIVAALHADEGICCVVGAGGKKTTLYALANRLSRAVVTATVRIPPFESHVAELQVTEQPAQAIATAERWPLGLVASQDGPDRYGGYDPAVVDAMADGRAAPILVKADGARMRSLKAPGPDEPQLPARAATVIPIASVRVVGEPLTAELVHRVDRVAAITDIDPGDPITPEAVATVLTHEQGGWKGVPPGATVVPLLNKVDTPALRDVGESVAAAIHERRSVDQVVLAAMRESAPLVQTV